MQKPADAESTPAHSHFTDSESESSPEIVDGFSESTISSPHSRITHTQQSNTLCLFFGAGASSQGGYRTFLTFPYMFWPTSSEPAILSATDKERVLLSAIRRELERGKRPLTLDQYLWILNDYKIVLQNIFSDEELRSRFSDSLLFLARVQELNQIVQRVRTHICELTVEHYRNPPTEIYYKRMQTFIAGLFNIYDHIELFTTNYDLVPEYILSKNSWCLAQLSSSWNKDIKHIINDHQLDSIQFFNGFENFESQDIIEQLHSQPIWSRNGYQINPTSKSFSLFRLHGCIAWYYKQQLKKSPVVFDVQGLDDIRNYFDRLCVMYPGKEASIGRDPHLYGFERLYDICLKSSVILFIGFAFRDGDVVSVIFNAIRQSLNNDTHKTIRIVVVDPHIDEDSFYERIESLRMHIALPLAQITEGRLQIVPIRSEFPPKEHAGSKAIFDALM